MSVKLCLSVSTSYSGIIAVMYAVDGVMNKNATTDSVIEHFTCDVLFNKLVNRFRVSRTMMMMTMMIMIFRSRASV